MKASVESSAARKLKLSVVTTAHNEAGNAEPFLSGVVAAIERLGVASEIVYIDDGSTDGTAEAVEAFMRSHPEAGVRLIRHPRKCGMTAALEEAPALARGEFICLVPADLESRPETDIPLLYGAADEGTDLVVGVRQGRKDGKALASKVYNMLNLGLFGIRLRDANWIKLIRRERMLGLRLRADWHRFLVALLDIDPKRIKEVVTPWHRRTYGASKFGLKRFSGSLADMVTIKLLLSYGRRPLLLFGWMGAALFVVSIAAMAVAAATPHAESKIWTAALVLWGITLTASLLSLGLGIIGEIILGSDVRPTRDIRDPR